MDAQAILDWIVENQKDLKQNIYLMGKSFGAAVACFTTTDLCSKKG